MLDVVDAVMGWIAARQPETTAAVAAWGAAGRWQAADTDDALVAEHAAQLRGPLVPRARTKRPTSSWADRSPVS